MVTPTPRAALITGKCFAAGVRATAQVLIIVVLALIMGVHMTMNPLKLLGALTAVVLGAAFFASNALYPLALMPGWLHVVSHVNPLSYEVDALRGLLVGGTAGLWTDFGVLVLAAVLGIACASALLGRLTR
ncbi:inner membrane transport permease [Nocardia africana]|uniref:Transport permease protein n=1 Tax=Nocardia africana TaxID=134964 RepID=A0A378WVG2_9NOCA|nr:inner membrane transport permease [Nocardia africana]